MYHVRNINQLKADTRWNTMMIKRHRKTLAVCHDCDALIHKSYGNQSYVDNGEPYTWKHVRTVRGQVSGNLPPQGGKALLAQPTERNCRPVRNQKKSDHAHRTTFNFPFPIEKQIIKALIILNR